MTTHSFKKKLIPFAAISVISFAGIFGAAADAQAKSGQADSNAKVKNVIFLIGDGMGNSYTSAYRYLKDDPTTKLVERTAMDEYLVGMQMTYAEDPDENITDSSSAATAMAAGIKTYNSAVAVDNDKSEVKTVLEAAKEQGKATGLVATSEITHATPASFGSHDPSRRNMNGIADDYFDELINGEHKVDVLLGGGTDLLIREDRNLVKEFQADGFSYVDSKQELFADDNEQVVGLFAPGGMPKMIDRDADTPSLKDMTVSALDRLSQDKDGFFLMVEGSQIDWAGHDNDIVSAMSEMEDFELAFQAAIDFAKKDKHTLVIATADHSTGGFSMGAAGQYNWLSEIIEGAKRTPDFMAQRIINGAGVGETLEAYSGFKVTAAEIRSVETAAAKNDLRAVDNAIEAIYNARTFTGWTTGGHTGEDVSVYAYGPSSDNFAGHLDNTDQAKLIFDLLKADVTITDK
ncbi:alkaline phosphatase [Planococcus lenghuensis]|uniref:Alkaline phosphatase n=1 Tax=Planococcus lenghuensis TaxID=2213202 RepID=A0A1Q2KVR5_9BACL|nr:alkaline phosphatase [Planococcus lenghuensis]AQQ52204.1 alkaline phosphatase [Planococcus lenghuensis]